MNKRFMGRYRPPPPPCSNLITPAGAMALKQELKQLWKDQRPQITQAIKEAAALGDRSENAEYIYGKKQLREIDRRIRYLQKRLGVVQVVRQIPVNRQKVYFGAQVTLQDQYGKHYCYHIVGVDEACPEAGMISIDSPLAQILLGRQVDDQVQLNGQQRYYCILAIDYDEYLPVKSL